ncbi:MAG: 30S ribosomal protein S8 [Microgenomates group bacterium]|nr:30S ribosomal protein S8 [Microgenomates group bacterium]
MDNSIIDLIIRIKNGYLAKKEIIISPYSKIREAVLKKLQELNFIKNFQIKGEKIKKIEIELLYKEGAPALTDVKIFSKPGRRWYVSVKHLKPVLNGLGYSILTSPKGIITEKEAKKLKTGGELLFQIW